MKMGKCIKRTITTTIAAVFAIASGSTLNAEETEKANSALSGQDLLNKTARTAPFSGWNVLQEEKDDEDEEAAKEETVYVITDAAGNSQKVIVSSWLKNKDGSTTITDVSDLSDIQNVQGDETYTQNGSELIWDAEGNDIYYQGTTSKEVPVKVKVSYTLDGKEVSADEIAGQSGHVTIRFDYENNAYKTVTINGKEEEIAIPFSIVSGMALPTENFTNVEVTNGRVVSEGKNNIVFGIAFPGLKESLSMDSSSFKDKIGDYDIPDYVEVEADAVDFQLGMTLTVAGTDLASQLKDAEDGNLDLSDIQDSINALTDASQQLVDGAQDLKDGTSQLRSGVNDVSTGVGKLDDGAQTLNSNMQTAASGASAVNSGLAQASSSLNTMLTDPSSQTGAGYAAFKTGLSQLATGSTADNAGLPYINGNLQAVVSAEKLGTVASGIQGLNTFASQGAALNVSSLQTALGEAKTAISTGSGNMNTAISGLGTYISKLEADQTALETAVSNLGSVTVTATTEMTDETQTETSDPDCGSLVAEQDTEENTIYVRTCTVTVTNTTTKTVTNTISPDFTELQTAVNNYKTDLTALKTALGAISVSADDMVSQLDNVINQLDQLNQVVAVAQNLQASTATLNVAMNGGTLPDGSTTPGIYPALQAISAGLNQATTSAQALNDGFQTIDQGLGTLNEGLAKVSTGTSSLADGTSKLASGSTALANGTSELRSNMPALVSGAAELDDGAQELLDGMTEFDEEGIQKLADVFGDDLDEVIDRLNAVMDAGSEYSTFSGASEDMDSSVKFIIKTGAINTASEN